MVFVFLQFIADQAYRYSYSGRFYLSRKFQVLPTLSPCAYRSIDRHGLLFKMLTSYTKPQSISNSGCNNMHRHDIEIQKSDGFQKKDVIELESCKQIKS